MFNYRNLAGNVERIVFPGLVPGRASRERRAILPQGISTSEISECEGIRESIALETERTTDAKTEDGEDERCWEMLKVVKVLLTKVKV